MVPDRSRALAVAGFALLALVLLHDATLSGGALFRRDLSLVWYPMVEAFVRCVAAGSWPVWDPWRGFGQPLLADARAAVLYPPTWVNLVAPPWTYQTWFAFGHLILAGCGARALCRQLGATRSGSFVAGCAWMAGGPLVALAGQFHHLAGAAWMPLILSAGVSVLAGPTGRTIATLSVALALQVLAGSPDYTAVTGLVLAALFAAHLASPARRARGLAALAAAVGLGLMLSAAQWLPTLAAARESARWAQSLETATVWSVHPLRLIELALPVPWGDASVLPSWQTAAFGGREPYLASIYGGALVLSLAAAALGGPLRGLLALATVAGVLALGSHTPLFPGALVVLPPLRLLRYPEKLIVLVGLCVALLAGLGYDALRSGRSESRHRALAATIVVLCASGAALAALAVTPIARLVLLSAAAVAVLLLRLAAPRRAALLAGLAILDLAASHHRLNPTAPVALFTTRPSPLAHVGSLDAARLYVYDYSLRFPPGADARPGAERYALARLPEGWSRSAALVLGVYEYLNPPTAGRWGARGSFDGDILDFYPASLGRLVRRLREVEGDAWAHTRLLQLGGVSHVLALHDASWSGGLERRASLPGLFREPIRVFEVPGSLPPVRVVGGIRPADDEAAAKLLTSPSFAPEHEILVPAAASVAPHAVGARVTVGRWSPDRIVLDASLDADGFLVLAEAFDPGWRVRVDGRATPVLRANLAFRAIALARGDHAVEMWYWPPGLSLGASLSAAAAVLLAVAWRRLP